MADDVPCPVSTPSPSPVAASAPLPISLDSTTSTPAVSYSYTPLPENSNKIRVLTLHSSADKGAQITCSLTTVDLNDQTQVYNDFQTRLFKVPIGYGYRSPVRHFMWNLVNIDPHELAEPRFSETAKEVAWDPSLNDFCDRPLEKQKGLVDWHVWGDFIALSYVWGDPTKRQEILLDGVPFGVGDNLYAALLRLRALYEVAERGLKVWIDAICIN